MTSYSFNEYGQERVKIYRLDGNIDIDAPIRIHNYHLIVLTSGELEVDINFRVFKMKAGSSLHISSGDVIRTISSPANEYSGYQIVFSPEFQTEIRTTRKSPISLQLKKEFPYQEFTESEYEVIHSSVLRLISYIENTSHQFQGIIVKNETHNLLLHISDKRRKEHASTDINANHQEMIRKRFLNLVDGHCDEQHSVSWYAEAMMISPDYLSKIIREYDGTSARIWINKAIISKAEFMMRQKDLSIKEISDRLHFPDQSSFGRFFKSNTGQSPKEYRNSLPVQNKDEADR